MGAWMQFRLIINLGRKFNKIDTRCYSETVISVGSALNPILPWAPSQYGLLLDAPHLHMAAKTLPSTVIKFGPFWVHLITTLVIAQMYSTRYIYKLLEFLNNKTWYQQIHMVTTVPELGYVHLNLKIGNTRRYITTWWLFLSNLSVITTERLKFVGLLPATVVILSLVCIQQIIKR